jgi:molybdate transport system substrate-binding protein
MAGFLFAGIAVQGAAAQRVSVAAAANLVFVLEPLNAEFAKMHPDIAVTCETSASGSLVSQISNGAPYDVFLSADLDYPRMLVKAGGAEGSSLVVFAVGRLVLWTTKPGIDHSSIESIVRSPSVARLAIANPRTAPYGRAAEETLATLGLADFAKPKIVTGENITQTAQYVSSGNVDAGFVALSLVLSPKLKDKGTWIEVPAPLYSPIEQGGVLTMRGAANAGARLYLDFLSSPAARRVLAQFGYGFPPSPAPH